MTDRTELKRLAEHHRSLGHAYTVATPSAVLALIAENEQLAKTADCWDRLNVQNKALSDSFRAERDQLRAEVAGLKTGYEAYERVNAELKAENEALREEVALGDKIIADRDRLLNMFDCPAHGQCIPYAMEQIEALRKDADKWKIVERAMTQLQSDEKGAAIWSACSRILISVAGKMNSARSTVTEEGVTFDGVEAGDWRVTVERVDAAMGQGEKS